MAKELGEIFETFVSANKFDEKGREIGFIVGLRDNGEDFYAWVQKARREVKTRNGVRLSPGDAYDFGPRQRSKKFPSHAAAKAWAYGTARERIAALK